MTARRAGPFDHLLHQRRFDSVHLLRTTPSLEQARRAARERRYQIHPPAGLRAGPG